LAFKLRLRCTGCYARSTAAATELYCTFTRLCRLRVRTGLPFTRCTFCATTHPLTHAYTAHGLQFVYRAYVCYAFPHAPVVLATTHLFVVLRTTHARLVPTACRTFPVARSFDAFGHRGSATFAAFRTLLPLRLLVGCHTVLPHDLFTVCVRIRTRLPRTHTPRCLHARCAVTTLPVLYVVTLFTLVRTRLRAFTPHYAFGRCTPVCTPVTFRVCTTPRRCSPHSCTPVCVRTPPWRLHITNILRILILHVAILHRYSITVWVLRSRTCRFGSSLPLPHIVALCTWHAFTRTLHHTTCTARFTFTVTPHSWFPLHPPRITCAFHTFAPRTYAVITCAGCPVLRTTPHWLHYATRYRVVPRAPFPRARYRGYAPRTTHVHVTFSTAPHARSATRLPGWTFGVRLPTHHCVAVAVGRHAFVIAPLVPWFGNSTLFQLCTTTRAVTTFLRCARSWIWTVPGLHATVTPVHRTHARTYPAHVALHTPGYRITLPHLRIRIVPVANTVTRPHTQLRFVPQFLFGRHGL